MDTIRKSETYPYNLLSDMQYRPSEIPLSEDQMEGIKYALSLLPEYLRETILLLYKDGQTPASVAEKFGVNEEAIDVRRQKALGTLRNNPSLRFIFYGIRIAQRQAEVFKKELELERRWNELLREEELYRKLAKKFGVEKKFFVESFQERMFRTSNEESFEKVSIRELGLTTRAHYGIARNDIFYVNQLMRMTVDDLMEIRNIGRKNVDEIVKKVFRLTGYDIRNNSKYPEANWVSPCSTCPKRELAEKYLQLTSSDIKKDDGRSSSN